MLVILPSSGLDASDGGLDVPAAMRMGDYLVGLMDDEDDLPGDEDDCQLSDPTRDHTQLATHIRLSGIG